MIGRWLNDVINLLYPPQCHLCGNDLTQSERFVCNPCMESLPRTGYHRKPRNPMEEKFAGQFPFKAATGHFFYSRDSELVQLIQDMKYRNFPSIGDKMGELAGKELFISGFLNDVEVIVPVPMHFLKKARRGYNQVEHIARGIGRAAGLPVVDALKMVRQRKTQTSLSGIERLSNAEGLFALRKNMNLSDKGVLLVDDICTTGATIGSAAKALTDFSPNIKLYIFTLAVTF